MRRNERTPSIWCEIIGYHNEPRVKLTSIETLYVDKTCSNGTLIYTGPLVAHIASNMVSPMFPGKNVKVGQMGYTL